MSQITPGPRHGRYRTDDPLLAPFDLAGVALRNRVVSTSHEPAYTENGLPRDRYRAYHVEKAKGGVGLTMIGGSAVVSPDSPPAFGNLLLYRDEIVPWFRRLTDDVHRHGAAVMCQITHLGRRSSNYTGDWLPLLAPSPLREPSHRAFPKEAEWWDIDRVVDDYAAGAQRCQDGGLDGIEIEAYGHLFDGFLSPATNRRDDEFGGSPEARLEFPRRVVSAIRKAVGPQFVVGLRMTLDERIEHGLGRAEALAALKVLVGDGVDFVSVIRGRIDSDQSLVEAIPIMGTPSAPHLEFAGEIRRALDVPVMHAARITDVATARHALTAGLLDLVGMTRAQMADPYLVAKVMRGEEDRIRPCVGASYCLDSIYDSGDAKCVHNPATGREQQLPHVITPSDHRRRAVVVGGGPAGLEAARVLAERGHRVVLFEAADRVGGQLLLASAGRRRRDLIAIADWRLSEARLAGAELRLGTWASRGDVLDEQPDLVVVATGGLPNTTFLDAASRRLVVDTWDVLSRSTPPRTSVLVYDDNGAYPGMDATELLAGTGAEVELVTPERVIAPDVGGMNTPAYLAAFARHGVRITLARRLVRVRRAVNGRLLATLWSEHADLEETREVDQVVVEHGTLPNDELYHELAPDSSNRGAVDLAALVAGRPQQRVENVEGSYQLFRIGDAVASRNIHAAIYDALRLCAPL